VIEVDRLLRVGLIGYPLRHSISPAFQQAAFDQLGFRVRYELWETPPDEVDGLAARLRQSDILGANVTIPYKQTVVSLLDRIDFSARSVGAVNTIVRQGNSLTGYNTDVSGFTESVRHVGRTSLGGSRIAIVGAGGAARAVVAAAIAERAESIVVCARRLGQAEGLAEAFRNQLLGSDSRLETSPFAANGLPPVDLIESADVVVNATPQGTAYRIDRERLPVDPRGLRAGQLVVDLVYNPSETPLLRVASERGARVLNGLPMLVYQGAAAFVLWTERPAPVELMRRVAREALGVRD
jgi:shikimate dehydrogenase